MKNLIVVAGTLALAGVASVLVGMSRPQASGTGAVDSGRPAMAGSDEHGHLVRIAVPARVGTSASASTTSGKTRLPAASGAGRDSDRQ